MKNLVKVLSIAVLLISNLFANDDLSLARDYGAADEVSAILKSIEVTRIIEKNSYGDGIISHIKKSQPSLHTLVDQYEVYFTKYNGEADSRCEVSVLVESNKVEVLSKVTCNTLGFSVWYAKKK